jgi:hypothetical protein
VRASFKKLYKGCVPKMPLACKNVMALGGSRYKSYKPGGVILDTEMKKK